MLENVEFRWYQRRPTNLRAGPPKPVLQYRLATIVPERTEWSEWKNIPLVQQWRE